MEKQPRSFLSSIDMNAYEIPCQNTAIKNDSLYFYVISDYYTYAYQFKKQNENYNGSLKIYSNETEQLLNTLETNLIKDNEGQQDELVKEEVSFSSNGLQLYGTIWKPKKSIQKALFFVTSSQGNDRSGTNAEAYYFTNLGYTVFDYDKRGTGKSEGNWQQATIEELCSDDINAVKYFSKIASFPLHEIGIKGSSQGGIKIPYILTKLPELGYGISISCPGVTLLESDLNYWKNVNANQIGKEDLDQALKIQREGYNYLAGNSSYEALTKLKNDYKDADFMKYVWIPEQDVQKDVKLNFSGLPYFEKITQPILVIQGLSDNIIPMNSYEIIGKAIEKSKTADYKVVTLKNTSHSMTVSNDEFPYFQGLNPEYLEAMNEWLKKMEKKE